MILPNNPIPELMARYRVLKQQADNLKAKMDALRLELEPLVERMEDQNWTDVEGYARFAVYNPSASFDNKAVDQLAQTWAESADAVMQSCGQMLLVLRRENLGRKSLQLR